MEAAVGEDEGTEDDTKDDRTALLSNEDHQWAPAPAAGAADEDEDEEDEQEEAAVVKAAATRAA